jgi:hypothetical protein
VAITAVVIVRGPSEPGWCGQLLHPESWRWRAREVVGAPFQRTLVFAELPPPKIKSPPIRSSGPFLLHPPAETTTLTSFPPSSYTLYPIANMRYSIALTAVLAGLGAASDVLDLKKDTLKAFVEENDLALIECEHHPRPN